MAVKRSATDSGIPKLAAGTRYLKEQLTAGGARVLLSEDCLKDFVLDAIEAATRTSEQGEPYITSLRRHLESRARFILRWVSTEEAFEDAASRCLVEIARKHGVRRLWRSAGNAAAR